MANDTATNHSVQPRRYLWLCALLALTLPGLISEGFFQISQQQLNRAQAEAALRLTRELGSMLEYELAAAFQPGNGLAGYVIASEGQPDVAIMGPWLAPLTNADRHLRNVAVAPGNTVTYVYPLEGNESVIGLHYPRNATQWPEIERIILARRPMLTGPLPLVQGGQGLIYRVPVYINQHYWGIVSTVINADTLFAQIQARAAAGRLRLALIEGRDKPRFWRHLWGDASLLQKPPLAVPLNVTGRDWQLLAAPEKHENQTFWLMRLIGWISGLLLAVLMLRLRQY